MNIYNQINDNKRKTIIILVFFVVFISFVGFVFGKVEGGTPAWFFLAFLLSLGGSIGGYLYGDKLVLTMTGAKPADRRKDFDFYTAAENMSIATGLPMPKLYVIEDESMNAFATGKDPQHSVVCVTRGLLDNLERSEIEGVISHEMSHIKNFDIRLMMIVSVLVGVVAFLADWFGRSLWWGGRNRDRDNNRSSGFFLIIGIVLAILSPIIATLIQLALSRKREYLADASGALVTRNPAALANALEKISQDKGVLETATNGTAHLFIANPFKGKNFGAKFAQLFDTHPPIQERIKILRSL